jgi:hypothetical protein
MEFRMPANHPKTDGGPRCAVASAFSFVLSHDWWAKNKPSDQPERPRQQSQQGHENGWRPSPLRGAVGPGHRADPEGKRRGNDGKQNSSFEWASHRMILFLPNVSNMPRPCGERTDNERS